MTDGSDPGARERRASARWWTRFGLALLAGAAVFFVWEIVDLVAALGRLETAEERGMIWAMLLMILGLLVVVGVIGGGLARAVWRSGRERSTGAAGASGDDGQGAG